MAHALRHAPWIYELELDEEGWVPLDSLVAALREKGGAWSALSRDRIEGMMAASEKQRYELKGGRFRACGISGGDVTQRPRAHPSASGCSMGCAFRNASSSMQAAWMRMIVG